MAAETIRLIIEKFGGTRWAAEQLTADLPEDLSATAVEVDCTTALSVAQGFTDELCKQLMELRRAKKLLLIHPTEKMAKHALMAAQLRGLEALEIVARD